MIYFTADLHFGHKNCLEFDGRPFEDVASMDRELIARWNQKVTDEDTVYILGDLSWHKPSRTREILDSLNGKKILVRGNHDHGVAYFSDCFEEVCDYKELNLPGKVHIVMSHYPILFFNRRYYGAYMLYGHVHASREWDLVEKFRQELVQDGQMCNMFNVGCMLHGYAPVSLEALIAGGACTRLLPR